MSNHSELTALSFAKIAIIDNKFITEPYWPNDRVMNGKYCSQQKRKAGKISESKKTKIAHKHIGRRTCLKSANSDSTYRENNCACPPLGLLHHMMSFKRERYRYRYKGQTT